MAIIKPKLIGISGTNGSGKDTVGQILANDFGYMFVSVTDILRDELSRRGLSLARENMRSLSAEWRRQYGLAVLIYKAEEIYAASGNNYTGLAMSSLRNPGEADEVHKKGGVVIWLDADPMVRYQRVVGASRGEHRAVDDQKTFEEFMADEKAEMHRPKEGDNATLDMQAVKHKSDLIFTNSANDLNALKEDLKQKLGL